MAIETNQYKFRQWHHKLGGPGISLRNHWKFPSEVLDLR